jgi:hypothetical protein
MDGNEKKQKALTPLAAPPTVPTAAPTLRAVLSEPIRFE